MALSKSSQYLVDRFTKNMSPEVIATFTEEQQEAIAQALAGQSWKKHPVDIRLSIPFLWQRYYFVCVAGLEKRSPQRLAVERTKYPLWTLTNLAIILGVMGFGIFTLLLGLWLSSKDFRRVLHQQFPTVVPFKGDQASCEKSGRVWKDGECLDFEHDPTF